LAPKEQREEFGEAGLALEAFLGGGFQRKELGFLLKKVGEALLIGGYRLNSLGRGWGSKHFSTPSWVMGN